MLLHYLNVAFVLHELCYRRLEGVLAHRAARSAGPTHFQYLRRRRCANIQLVVVTSNNFEIYATTVPTWIVLYRFCHSYGNRMSYLQLYHTRDRTKDWW